MFIEKTATTGDGEGSGEVEGWWSGDEVRLGLRSRLGGPSEVEVEVVVEGEGEG